MALGVLLTGCQIIPEATTATNARQLRAAQLASPVWRGHKFAQDRCSECHGVEAGQISANSRASGFAVIANRPGLTKATLDRWLRTQQLHPEPMYFQIPAEHIEDLVSYMISLRADSTSEK